MKMFCECQFYTVTSDLSVIQCDTLDECTQVENFQYGIEEIYSNDGTQAPHAIRLFNHHKMPILLNENGWRMTALNVVIVSTFEGLTQYVPAVDVEDPCGIIQMLTSNKQGYEG